jgi:hypothetical protein
MFSNQRNFGDSPEDFEPHRQLAIMLQSYGGLNEWEERFLFTIKHQDYPPSPKQLAVLARISRKVTGYDPFAAGSKRAGKR